MLQSPPQTETTFPVHETVHADPLLRLDNVPRLSLVQIKPAEVFKNRTQWLLQFVSHNCNEQRWKIKDQEQTNGCWSKKKYEMQIESLFGRECVVNVEEKWRFRIVTNIRRAKISDKFHHLLATMEIDEMSHVLTIRNPQGLPILSIDDCSVYATNGGLQYAVVSRFIGDESKLARIEVAFNDVGTALDPIYKTFIVCGVIYAECCLYRVQYLKIG